VTNLEGGEKRSGPKEGTKKGGSRRKAQKEEDYSKEGTNMKIKGNRVEKKRERQRGGLLQ